MEFVTEITSQGRRNRSSHTPNVQQAPPTYGYHNTYHTHAQVPLGAPPSYARATDPKLLRHLEEKAQLEAAAARTTTLPPAYTCTVEQRGLLAVRQELSSPFHAASNRVWYDAYLVLEGTHLSLHRVKSPSLLSKNRHPTPGRLLKSYSLQHAEVGVASDFKRSALIPRSPFAHLVPSAARPKLYETDPHLFEPVREHVIRLRLETEQFLICAPTQESMLSWLESLCASVDISAPIEDRSEPRYRSLPRRSRRQRVLDGAQLGDNMDNLTSLEAGRRIIAQQEQIIRQLYPHLAGAREPGHATPAAELELEDFDPEDVRFPTNRSRASMQNEDRPVSRDEADRKNADRERPSAAQSLRYRRRCAPVLLVASPRVSDVVFCEGKRMRINVKEHDLVEYQPHPPRYDAHSFPKSRRPAKITTIPTTTIKVAPVARPGSPIRGVSDDSITSISFGEELVPTTSRSTDDISASGPPSPTHTKHDASRQLAELGKSRSSEDGRDTGLSAVAMGVGLLI